MHTVELFEQALSVAEQLGYGVRQEWLGGSGGGACEFAGRKWIFVDLALNSVEQLEQVTEALQGDPAIFAVDLPPSMRDLLGIRKSA
ncbi:MAG: hypothetical protein H8E44_05860 [Planctomycetes bacterium]|nr:hypothetical protein [Planctomycetota bacterium]MBL7041190.1 hypothetical protein [Pirellulaceae bacterium]